MCHIADVVELGRHARFKPWCPKGRASSILAIGTNMKSFSNDQLIDAVDRIRLLNGEEPVTFRGIKNKTVLEFQTARRKKIYYKVEDIIKFLDGVQALDDEYLGDRITYPGL